MDGRRLADEARCLLDGQPAVLDAAREAWNALAAPGRETRHMSACLGLRRAGLGIDSTPGPSRAPLSISAHPRSRLRCPAAARAKPVSERDRLLVDPLRLRLAQEPALDDGGLGLAFRHPRGAEQQRCGLFYAKVVEARREPAQRDRRPRLARTCVTTAGLGRVFPLGPVRILVSPAHRRVLPGTWVGRRRPQVSTLIGAGLVPVTGASGRTAGRGADDDCG